MSSIGFLTSKDKYVTINEPDNHPRNVSYIIFRSYLNPHTVDPRALNIVQPFEFSLRLPHNPPTYPVKPSVSRFFVVTN